MVTFLWLFFCSCPCNFSGYNGICMGVLLLLLYLCIPANDCDHALLKTVVEQPFFFSNLHSLYN